LADPVPGTPRLGSPSARCPQPQRSASSQARGPAVISFSKKYFNNNNNDNCYYIFFAISFYFEYSYK
jgi:hypothetical protein